MGRTFHTSTRDWLAAPENPRSASPPSTLTPLLGATRRVLAEHYGNGHTRFAHARTAFAELCEVHPDGHVETLTTTLLRTWVERMQGRGNRTATINSKLTVVGVLFEHLQIDGCKVPFVREPRPLKWWMTPELEASALGWCTDHSRHDLADYIRWAVLTGLRVEETLRAQRQHFTGLGTERPSLTVPGTKTTDAQATIPLFLEAAALAARRLGASGITTQQLFPAPPHVYVLDRRKTSPTQRAYLALQSDWQDCRHALGLDGTHGATLKALRRSMARLATERGMPTSVLQKYLRHGDIKTTEGYLKLVGGYDTELMRQWVR